MPVRSSATDWPSAFGAMDVKLNLTPDPKILIALTATPLHPLDALCELIDNAIDSFTDARLQGTPVEYPLVVVQIPGPAEVRRGTGSVLVRDNGLGLTQDGAEKALTAGFSGKAPRGGRLGLFGMGFNIASGKLGHRTRFLTARRSESKAISVTVDLNQMQRERSYEVPAELVDRPGEFVQGTIVEVSGWWPEGNPNHGFVRKLAAYSSSTIVSELSRRYATILREHGVRIQINQSLCVPFEHCVWDKARSVERRGAGRIPARFDFNEVLAIQTRCNDCDTLILEGQASCPHCQSASQRTIDERVRGWVGIQRFDDATEFGIDLIRNGRAIRIGEKDAFFSFVDEFKREMKDYPIDSQYGRIVGEVHLDHIPVDFLKQDFQRSSDEWRRAMTFLRGDSSLQPTQPNAADNNSFIYRLYQGYRKVRTPGKTDMYMGKWDETDEKPKRISRDVEKDYYKKFAARVPGYYDDAEWWALVETADQPPPPKLVECPSCRAENLPDTEVCQVCGAVLVGQPCISPDCQKLIPRSAASCPHCGASQVPEIADPWHCDVCETTNDETAETCSGCGRPRNSLHPGSRDYLLANSQKNDALCIVGMSIVLANGDHSQPTNVDVYDATGPLTPVWQGKNVPLISFKGETVEIFVDRSHALFRSYRVRPESLIAGEIAQWIYDLNRALLQRPTLRGAHSVSNLAWAVMSKYWAEQLEDSSELVRADIDHFFTDIRADLPRLAAAVAEDIFSNLTEQDQRSLTNNMLAQGQDFSKLGEWSRSGDFLRFVDPSTIVNVFRLYPHLFFDGGVWTLAYSQMPGGLQDAVIQHVQNEVKAQYLNCLDDCAAYLRYTKPDALVTQRARVSLTFLAQRAV